MAADLHLESWFWVVMSQLLWVWGLIFFADDCGFLSLLLFLKINDEICCDFMCVCVEMEGTNLIWAPFCECNQGNKSCSKWNVIVGLSWIWFINCFGCWRCKLFYLSNIKTKEKNEGGVCPLWNLLWEKKIFA